MFAEIVRTEQLFDFVFSLAFYQWIAVAVRCFGVFNQVVPVFKIIWRKKVGAFDPHSFVPDNIFELLAGNLRQTLDAFSHFLRIFASGQFFIKCCAPECLNVFAILDLIERFHQLYSGRFKQS
ncbi:MAG: hypothetical protein ACD_39C01058G0002 [uncultured bacterium]|nr:MAG: hypothetical protein ACD_39C01058G0002 [uncultured bacterium]